MDAGVKDLEDKIRKWKPESVAIVGKSIWESIWRVKKGRGIKKDEFRYGWQADTERMGIETVMNKTECGRDFLPTDCRWMGSKVFVACSTSGLAATLSPLQKQNIWNELGEWVKQRRIKLGKMEMDQ